jgi:hypothetical protein
VLGTVAAFRSDKAILNIHDFEDWLADNEASLRKRAAPCTFQSLSPHHALCAIARPSHRAHPICSRQADLDFREVLFFRRGVFGHTGRLLSRMGG